MRDNVDGYSAPTQYTSSSMITETALIRRAMRATRAINPLAVPLSSLSLLLLCLSGISCDDETIPRLQTQQDQGALRDATPFIPEAFDQGPLSQSDMAFGRFGDPCESARECSSGYCIDFEGSRVCTELCFEDQDCELGLICGTLTNTGDDQQLLKAIISSSEREMERGDLVFANAEKLIEVNPTKNLVDLEGVIVDSLADISEFGQHHMVFINVGSEEGVQVGNRLAIARRGDGLMKFSAERDQQMPLEPVGELMVISTQAHTASALITRSTLELRRGDQVLMLRNY